MKRLVLLCDDKERKILIESTCNVGDLGSIPGLGRSPEKGMATHSSILACRIPRTLQCMGLQRVGHNWVTFTFQSFNWCLFCYLSQAFHQHVETSLSHLYHHGTGRLFSYKHPHLSFLFLPPTLSFISLLCEVKGIYHLSLSPFYLPSKIALLLFYTNAFANVTSLGFSFSPFCLL